MGIFATIKYEFLTLFDLVTDKNTSICINLNPL